MKEEGSNKSEAGSGILSWLNRTRKLEEKRNCAREKARRLSKKLEEQDNLGQGGSDDEDHTHDDLAGVKILDGLDKVVHGGAVVLTLKDQSILAEEGPKVVVFTEIEEFVSGLQFDQAIRDDTKGVSIDGLTEANETVNDEEMKEVPDEDGIIREVPVGKGLSGALKLLHDRATLKEESIIWGGRNMDKKKSKNKDNDMDRFSNINLERTDEFGRRMTPKEAFRAISHRFHGKGPGKMKLEKRMKQFQEEQKLLKRMNNLYTASLSAERMREAQAQLKTPYLVLSGHVKPGQTRDPRSRVAAVEHVPGLKRKRNPDAASDY